MTKQVTKAFSTFVILSPFGKEKGVSKVMRGLEDLVYMAEKYLKPFEAGASCWEDCRMPGQDETAQVFLVDGSRLRGGEHGDCDPFIIAFLPFGVLLSFAQEEYGAEDKRFCSMYETHRTFVPYQRIDRIVENRHLSEWDEDKAKKIRAAEVSQKGPGEHPAGFPVKARGL